MKQLALGLAVVAFLLALALVFRFVDSPEQAPGAATSRQAQASEPARGEPAELARPEAPAPAAAVQAPAPAPEATPAPLQPVQRLETRRDAADVRSLAGRLVLPAGMPDDGQLAIEAWSKEPEPGVPGFSLIDEEADDGLLARVEPGAGGDFELELPADAGEAWVIARGSYLIAAPRRVALPHEGPLVLEPELGAWITGRAVLPAGAEVPADEDEWKARLEPDRVALIRSGNPFAGGPGEAGPTRREAAIDRDDGLRFELTGVRPAQGYTVQLVPDSLAAFETERFDLRPGQHHQVELRLVRGGTLAGRVVDDGGRGVAGAELEVVQDPFMFGQGGFEVRSGEADDEGRFELRAVRPGKLTVRIEADGHLDGSKELELAPGERRDGLELVLESGARIAGSVRWPDGTPAVGVEVEVRFDMSFLGGMEAMNAMRGSEGDGETGDDGRFVVSGLGKGPFVVRAEAEREQDGEELEWVARASAVRPGGEDLELVLEPPLGVAGRVVDDLGQPVSAFGVHARTRTSGMLAGLGAETSSDEFESEDGSFFLGDLRPGEWEVFASGEGYGRGQPTQLTLPQEAGAELTLVLDRASGIAGRVLDPAGNPVAGASVGRKLGLADMGRLGSPGGGEPREAKTEADGAFALEGLQAGQQELVARHPDFAPSAPLPVELAPAETLSELVLTLRTGGRVLGVVYDDEGRPWPGQMILLQEPTLATGQQWATSDGAGEFLFEHLAPAQYQVMTFPKERSESSDDGSDNDFTAMFSGMKFTMAQVREGEDTWVELGAAPSDPVRVKGKVVAGGRPVPGAMVTFFADGSGGFESMKFASSGSDGRFELELGSPGRYMVNVQQMAGTGQQQSVELLREIPEVETHELTLELPVGQVAGVVRGPDGQPVQNARISLAADGPIANGSFTGGNYAEIWTDAQGRYELRWLRPGRYSVAAGGAFLGGLFGDTGDVTYGRQVRRIQLAEGEALTGVDFRLETPGRITGRVVDLAGVPVAEAAIFLRDQDGNPVDRISMVTTNASGRFEYASLEPGTYRVQARSRAQVSATPTTVRVRESEESEVELSLDEGTILVVSLSDREGNHVRCRVRVTDSDGNQVNGLWSFADLMDAFSGGGFSTDEQRVGPLPAGKYEIEATAEDGRDARKTVTLSGQEERPVKLRLD